MADMLLPQTPLQMTQFADFEETHIYLLGPEPVLGFFAPTCVMFDIRRKFTSIALDIPTTVCATLIHIYYKNTLRDLFSTDIFHLVKNVLAS